MLKPNWPNAESIALNSPFYFAAYTLWLVFAILNTSAIESIAVFKVYVYAAVPFLLVLHELSNDLRERWDFRDFALFASLVLLNVQTYLLGHNDLLALALLVFCGRKVSFRDFARITVVVSVFLTVALVILSLLGLIPMVVNVRSDGSVRYSLGFAYVTYMPYVLLNILSLRIYLLKGRISIPEILLWLFVAVGTYIATDARNSCILLFVLLGWCIFRQISDRSTLRNATKRGSKLRIWVLSLTFIVLACVFIFASISYNPTSPVHQLFNDITSERLQRSRHAIDYFGLPFFGGTTEILSDQNLIIDDSYMRIIFDHGIITLLAALAVYTIALKRALEEGVWYVALILIVLAAHSVFDAQLLSLQQNSLILLSVQMALKYSDSSGESLYFPLTDGGNGLTARSNL